MPVRILHTADLHIGMKFTRGYAPEVQQRLVETRIDVFGRLIDLAGQRDCDLLVVAGDLFDTPRVAKRDVLRAAGLLSRFEGGLVLILPGNHDYYQGEDDALWSAFRSAMGERTILLTEPKPYDLRRYDVDLIAYPAPCTAKHSQEHAVGWVGDCPKDRDVRLHVGIAHGSLEGLSPDFAGDYYPMSQDDLNAGGLDLWLMGHTHVRHPAQDGGTGATVFFPGTPEPDGFDCSHAGAAWIIELGDDGTITFESVATGQYRFRVMTDELGGDTDIERLRRRFEECDPERDLVKLAVSGRVPREIYEARADLAETWESDVLHLEVDWLGLLQAITPQDIDREFTDGSFPHRLLSALAERDGRDPLALQTAYDLIREVRP